MGRRCAAPCLRRRGKCARLAACRGSLPGSGRSSVRGACRRSVQCGRKQRVEKHRHHALDIGDIGQTRIADHVCAGSAWPRSLLCDRRCEDPRRAGVVAEAFVRGGASCYCGVVSDFVVVRMPWAHASLCRMRMPWANQGFRALSAHGCGQPSDGKHRGISSPMRVAQ